MVGWTFKGMYIVDRFWMLKTKRNINSYATLSAFLKEEFKSKQCSTARTVASNAKDKNESAVLFGYPLTNHKWDLRNAE